MNLMKLHEELDKSLARLIYNAEHRRHRISEELLLDLIARIDRLSQDLYLLKGTKL